MSGEIPVTLTGNLTNDPEQRNVNGQNVVTFTIAQNSRYTDRNGQRKDGNTVFMRCTVWGQLGDHILQSGLHKGMPVIAVGTLRQSSYTDQNGSKHSITELNVTDCGPSLRYATAQVTRVERPQTNGYGYQQGSYSGYANNNWQQRNNGYANNYQQQGNWQPQPTQNPPQQQPTQAGAPQQTSDPWNQPTAPGMTDADSDDPKF